MGKIQPGALFVLFCPCFQISSDWNRAMPINLYIVMAALTLSQQSWVVLPKPAGLQSLQYFLNGPL